MRKKSGGGTDNAKDSRIFEVEKKRMVKYLKGDIMNTFFCFMKKNILESLFTGRKIPVEEKWI